MFITSSPSPQSGLDTLAQAWLGAGAIVSIWDRHQMIRHWPAHVSLDAADFVTPIRIGNDVYGEMRISGFSAPGWAGWNQYSTPALLGAGVSNYLAGSGHTPECRNLPSTLCGVDIFADSRPSLEVGGDYYDFVYQPCGRLAFNVADISGKGLSAAMFMPKMHRALRGSLQSTVNSAPHELLIQLNDDVFSLFADTGCFATALLGCYDPGTRKVTYANAGHSPVIYRSTAGRTHLLKADTVPLGIQEHIDSVERTVKLDPGDIFVVGTDGLAEAKNSTGQMFGYRRLLALIDSLAHRTAHSIVNALFQEIAAFTDQAPQNDDHTVIVLKGTS